MIPVVTGQALLLVLLAMTGLLLARLVRIDKTIACLVVGFGAGQLVGPLGIDTGIRYTNVQDLVFYLLLPPLLFQAAWHIPPRMLRRWVLPIFIYGILGVAISVAISAVLIHAGINHPGFPWMAALLTGAILAATDPVSIVALLRSEEDAPEDLAVLLEGESLFNDAAAAVLFSIFLGLALNSGDAIATPTAVANLLLHIVGGILSGLVFGLVTAILVLFFKSTVIANLILVVSAFGSFYIAHQLLGFSGIIAVVITALIARSGLCNFEQRFLRDTEVTWTWLGESFIALIFTLMGLVIVPAMFVDRWLAIAIAIGAALVARAVTVYTCSPLSSLLMRHRNIPVGWWHLQVWGGLRGAIAIALVLTIPIELPYWYTIQAMVFGVVLFNLLVQGTSCRPLIRRLGKASHDP